MTIIKGNLLEISKGVIIHQVNNRRVMGAGIAKDIRTMYPKHYIDYMNHSLELGTIVTTKVNKSFGVAGMVAQNGYGRDGKRYTDYEAFEKCLYILNEYHKKSPNCKFYMPYGIGCSLAGGDWSYVSGLIETISPHITIVMLNK